MMMEILTGNKTIHSIKTEHTFTRPVCAKYQVFGDFYVSDSGLVTAGGKSFNLG